MTERVVRRTETHPVSDFWFAQIDLRLARMEALSNRIERGVTMIIYGGAALLVIESLRLLIAAGPTASGVGL